MFRQRRRAQTSSNLVRNTEESRKACSNPSGGNGCKLVLTTRSEHICKYIGCKVIKVKTLSEEEALILFLNKVGPNIVQSPTIMPTLKLVVKECASLPLTIVVVAGTM
ncbi:hypothetical protein Gotur_016409, partial [Gossypium turneri]